MQESASSLGIDKHSLDPLMSACKNQRIKPSKKQRIEDLQKIRGIGLEAIVLILASIYPDSIPPDLDLTIPIFM
jgi:hypothetical protein